MGFYHRITLALAIICLFVDSGLGAPLTGRYMFVKCNPDLKNANCVTQVGPLVPLSGKSSRLPPSAAKHIFPVSTEEATPETEEQSGEGSGNSDTFAPFRTMDQRMMRDAPVPTRSQQEANKNEEEGSAVESSGDIYLSQYDSTRKTDWLSEQDLKEENIIA
ncbi:serglycin-like [Carassius auratus]|uniref:Serglycin-like n=1 Tax=Carassius auratus TaxID=7957 RepID=A0A6P6QLJ8_CARAU|nr:serglycin-like [Carassius auratus]XP_026134414.1 serglycin-like [Carassius auratus]XP_052469104.1 serglycin [Carassius gibelio]